MRRNIKKSYGEYQVLQCPFCGRQATRKNKQGLNVCYTHAETSLQEKKCLCGSWLELRSGKFGPYFYCVKCGNLNLKKGLEMDNLEVKPSRPTVDLNQEKTITSRDVDYF